MVDVVKRSCVDRRVVNDVHTRSSC